MLPQATDKQPLVQIVNHAVHPPEVRLPEVRPLAEPQPAPKPTQKPASRFEKFVAKCQAYLWEGGGLVALGLLNMHIVSWGLTEINPVLLGGRISFLRWIPALAKATWGDLLALAIFVALAFSWRFVLRDLLMRSGNTVVEASTWSVSSTRLFWRIVCGGLMVLDGYLFYRSLLTAEKLWDRGDVSYTEVLALSIGYIFGVAIYTFGCLYFWDAERKVNQ